MTKDLAEKNVKKGRQEETEYELDFLDSIRFNYGKGYIRIKDDKEIFLTPRLNELLYQLLKHKNELVTRRQLMTSVWKNVVVSEESLTKAISDLKKFFNTHDIRNAVITSISKRGYKLEIIQYPVAETKPKRLAKFLIKGLLYLILFCAFLIIMIRAIFSSGYS